MEPQFLSGEKNQDKVKVCKALNQDDMHLLETFPVEVWLHVLDRIWDPETLYNLSEAALFWKRIMAPRRTEYLFPQVLELLAADKHLSHVCGNELLKWRCVCKSWKLGVNMILEKNQDTHRQTFPKHRFDLCGHLDVSIGFALYRPQAFGLVKQENANAFEKLYKHCHKSVLHSPSNIFPCRYLIIDQAFFESLHLIRLTYWFGNLLTQYNGQIDSSSCRICAKNVMYQQMAKKSFGKALKLYILVIQGNVKVYKGIYEDSILLLERLPQEVWLLVLIKIWEPETRFNLSEAALFGGDCCTVQRQIICYLRYGRFYEVKYLIRGTTYPMNMAMSYSSDVVSLKAGNLLFIYFLTSAMTLTRRRLTLPLRLPLNIKNGVQ